MPKTQSRAPSTGLQCRASVFVCILGGFCLHTPSYCWCSVPFRFSWENSLVVLEGRARGAVHFSFRWLRVFIFPSCGRTLGAGVWPAGLPCFQPDEYFILLLRSLQGAHTVGCGQWLHSLAQGRLQWVNSHCPAGSACGGLCAYGRWDCPSCMFSHSCSGVTLVLSAGLPALD